MLHFYEECFYLDARVNPRRTNTKDQASRERRLKPATTLHCSTIDDISLKVIEVCSLLHSCGKKLEQQINFFSFSRNQSINLKLLHTNIFLLTFTSLSWRHAAGWTGSCLWTFRPTLSVFNTGLTARNDVRPPTKRVGWNFHWQNHTFLRDKNYIKLLLY